MNLADKKHSLQSGKRIMSSRSIINGLACCVCLFFGVGETAAFTGQEARPAASSPAVTLRTWAVLAPTELRKSGLEDQVMAGLAAEKTIMLVDRQHLDLVAKELVMGKLTSASDTSSRRSAGAAIRADALAILSLESVNKELVVRLVICETQAGARLLVDSVPYKADNLDHVAKALVLAIEQTRQRFPQGVQRVYAVLPFVSRSLSHEYDYLQRGYASLLANALSSQSGVAVIEIDEARQISREIVLTDGKEVQRIVPLFVEAEYEVIPPGADKTPSVRLSVKVTGGKSSMTTQQRTAKLPEISGYLTKDLPVLMCGETMKGQTLTVEQQASALVARADAFARLGAWEYSADLREASLLLKDDPAQRKLLAGEYRGIMRAPLPAGVQNEAARNVLRARQWESWRLAVGHLEYLIRNRQANIGWIYEKISWLFGEDLRRICTDPQGEDVDQAERTRRRFLRDLYIPMWQMTIDSKSKPSDCWNSRLFLSYPTCYRKWTKEDLDLYYEMLVKITPVDDRRREPFMAEAGSFSGSLRAYDFSPEDYLAFVGQLEKSDRLENRVVGRLGLLWLKWNRAKYSTDSLESLLKEAEALRAEFEGCPEVRNINPELKHRVNYLYEEVKKTHTNRSLPNSPDLNPPRVTAEPVNCRVSFQNLDLQVRSVSGKLSPLTESRRRGPDEERAGEPNFKRLRNCGTFDVIWDERTVILHRQKGVLEEVISDANAKFSDIQWDGRQLWLGDRNGNIRILSAEGKEIRRVTSQHGLPPCDQRLLLHPLPGNKAIAVANIGPHYRLWCGLVELDDTPKVTLFYQGTRVRTPKESPENNILGFTANIDVIHEHQWTKDGPKVLLVGCGLMTPALEIDLNSLKVTVSKAREFSWTMYSHEGYIVQVHEYRPILIAPPDKPFKDGKDFHYLNKPVKTEKMGLSLLSLLCWQNRLYVPGRPWFRITPGTWETEILDCPRMPGYSFTVSAHYGIVGWSGSKSALFRVIFADEEGAGNGSKDNSVKQPVPAASNK